MRGVRARPGRAALLCALAAGLLWPGDATAQGDRGTPVVGGGSLNTAPLLGSGTYSDTVLPAEGTFYRVELRRGQRLELDVDFDTSQISDNPFARTSANLFYNVEIYTPLRQPLVTAYDAEEGQVSESQFRRTKLVLGYEELLDGNYTDDLFLGPGPYYIQLSTRELFGPPDLPVEIPTRFAIRVTGAGQPSSRDFAPPLISESRPGAEPSSASDGSGGERLGPLELTGSSGSGREDSSVIVAAVLAGYGLAGGIMLGALGGRIVRPRAS